MADTNASKIKLPFSTGNSAVDTAIAGAIAGAGGIITGWMVAQIKQYGWYSPEFDLYIFGTVTGTLTSLAVIGWRMWISYRSKIMHADVVITAVATGHIPEDVKKTAVAAPQISDEKIMTAVTNAEEIKQRNV